MGGFVPDLFYPTIFFAPKLRTPSTRPLVLQLIGRSCITNLYLLYSNIQSFINLLEQSALADVLERNYVWYNQPTPLLVPPPARRQVQNKYKGSTKRRCWIAATVIEGFGRPSVVRCHCSRGVWGLQARWGNISSTTVKLYPATPAWEPRHPRTCVRFSVFWFPEGPLPLQRV